MNAIQGNDAAKALHVLPPATEYCSAAWIETPAEVLLGSLGRNVGVTKDTICRMK